MLQLFQHQDAGAALGEQEAAAIPAKGTGQAIRGLRQDSQHVESPHHETVRVLKRLDAAGQHHLRIAILDSPESLADGVGARGAGSVDGVAGTGQAKTDGSPSGGRVGHRFWHDHSAKGQAALRQCRLQGFARKTMAQVRLERRLHVAQTGAKHDPGFLNPGKSNGRLRF